MCKFLAIVLILLVISTMASNADAAETLAQPSSGDFKITKSTIDNGGGLSFSGEFSLTGTIGQPDASQEVAIGGEYFLSGGFWANATVINVIFKDNFESD